MTKRFILALFPLLMACSGISLPGQFKVVSSDGNDSCATLGDYCLQITCVVKNDSPLPGQAVVDLQLLDAGGNIQHTHTERITLGAGDTGTVTHAFTEARLLGRESKYDCELR